MITNRPLRVFLCHSSNDKPAVRELYQKLRAEAWIQPWLDEEELFPVMDWNLEIEKAVESADAIIVCLSKGSITKEGYVQKEIRAALDYADYKPEGTLFIIPVRLEECTPPKRLARWQYADYFEGQRERGFERLCASLKRRTNSLELNPQKAIQPLVEKETSEIRPRVKKQKRSENVILKVDPLFEECVKFAQERGQISAAMIKSKMRIGYTRASQILFTMERKEIIGPAEGEMQIHKLLNFAPKSSQTSLLSQNKITLSNGMEFMHVPAGEFLMGSNNGNDDERPQVKINVSYDYWTARFPVTNLHYYSYVRSKKIKHPVADWSEKKDHPVVNITWRDAATYCEWLGRKLRNELPSKLVLRLPTEAEWEKAARSGDGRDYPWGNVFIKDGCNFNKGILTATSIVGLYSPVGDSPFGCADMSGNVWEWTNSLKLDYPYMVTDGREHPQMAEKSRALRGGSFYSYSLGVRCSARLDGNPTGKSEDVGFRVVIATPIW